MGLHVPEPTPFASDRRVFVPLVELNVLNWVSKTDLVHASATDYAAVDLHNGHAVDQLLSVGSVSLSRYL